MALAGIKTWVDGEVLSHTDLNAEFSNILNNALALISPLTGDLSGGDNDLFNIKTVSIGKTAAGAVPLDVTDEDTRTNTVAYHFVLGATTSGTPAANIGTGIRVQAESGDENPSTMCELDFILTDVTATAEDSDFILKLREGGAAVAERFRVASDGTTTITGAGLIIDETDARTATVDVPLTVRSTTTGTPAANIGTGIRVQAESGDENPSTVCELDFLLTDVTAASEDSDLVIKLRRAGVAVAETVRFVGLDGGIKVTDAAPATPVAKTLYSDSIIKAWVTFQSGAGGAPIQDDLNVSSTDDDGVGDFGVNFATAMATAEYAFWVSVQHTGGGDWTAFADGMLTTSIDVATKDAGTLTDATRTTVGVIGNN